MRSFILAYAVPAWQDIPETLTVVLINKTNSRYFEGVFSKTITLLALVGYDIIKANSSLRAFLVAYNNTIIGTLRRLGSVFFAGVPSYFEALWYLHLYFYSKFNT